MLKQFYQLCKTFPLLVDFFVILGAISVYFKKKLNQFQKRVHSNRLSKRGTNFQSTYIYPRGIPWWLCMLNKYCAISFLTLFQKSKNCMIVFILLVAFFFFLLDSRLFCENYLSINFFYKKLNCLFPICLFSLSLYP